MKKSIAKWFELAYTYAGKGEMPEHTTTRPNTSLKGTQHGF
jgi:hypothetical protein